MKVNNLVQLKDVDNEDGTSLIVKSGRDGNDVHAVIQLSDDPEDRMDFVLYPVRDEDLEKLGAIISVLEDAQNNACSVRAAKNKTPQELLSDLGPKAFLPRSNIPVEEHPDALS